MVGGCGVQDAAAPARAALARSEQAHRLGYVSSDFRIHSAAFAFLPVLRGHDKAQFQINCYSSSTSKDAFTATFQSIADVWVDAVHLSEDELADRIQADGVDILVDLSGYTTGNRMPVFARKPAPVQVTAWGSGTGTGLADHGLLLRRSGDDPAEPCGTCLRKPSTTCPR